MPELEEKLGAILGNPELMKTLASMAQALNAPSQPPQEGPPPPPPPQPSSSGAELELLGRIAAFSRQTSLSQEEQSLLKALGPFLSPNRVGRLERAMQASRLARLAASAMAQSGGQPSGGR